MDFATPNLKTFQVLPNVPPALQPLLELAQNLWWVWHPDAVELFQLGCEYAQGFVFGEPMTAERARALLEPDSKMALAGR